MVQQATAGFTMHLASKLQFVQFAICNLSNLQSATCGQPLGSPHGGPDQRSSIHAAVLALRDKSALVVQDDCSHAAHYPCICHHAVIVRCVRMKISVDRTLISCMANTYPRHMRFPDPKGIQEPALRPSSVSHLSQHHSHMSCIVSNFCHYARWNSLIIVSIVVHIDRIVERRVWEGHEINP